MAESIVILACSMKHSGRCLAGKTMINKQWIRLVGDVEGAELAIDQTFFSNNYGTQNKAKPMQKIQMNIGQHAPLAHQPENYIAIPGWSQIPGYNLRPSELKAYADTPASLWGTSDRVSNTRIGREVPVPQSLYLVKVTELSLYRNGQQRRATFNYNGMGYDLACTDLSYDDFEAERRRPNGYLCISLGEDFRGDHYKIVATIFGESV